MSEMNHQNTAPDAWGASGANACVEELDRSFDRGARFILSRSSITQKLLKDVGGLALSVYRASIASGLEVGNDTPATKELTEGEVLDGRPDEGACETSGCSTAAEFSSEALESAASSTVRTIIRCLERFLSSQRPSGAVDGSSVSNVSCASERTLMRGSLWNSVDSNVGAHQRTKISQVAFARREAAISLLLKFARERGRHELSLIIVRKVPNFLEKDSFASGFSRSVATLRSDVDRLNAALKISSLHRCSSRRLGLTSPRNSLLWGSNLFAPLSLGSAFNETHAPTSSESLCRSDVNQTFHSWRETEARLVSPILGNLLIEIDKATSRSVEGSINGSELGMQCGELSHAQELALGITWKVQNSRG